MTTLRHLLTLSIAVASLAMIPGLTHPTSAQDGSPAASPAAAADCTANLGLVRSSKACLAVVHAALGTPAVDVYLNGEIAVTALAPNSATGFIELPAADYLVHVVPTGGSIDQAVVTVDTLTVEATRAYEVAVANDLVDAGTGEEELRAAVLDVTTYSVPASGAGLPQSRVRVVHAVTGGKAIDAALIADDIAMPVADDLEFGDAGPYLERPSGTYRLTVSATWGDVLLDEPTLALGPDTVTSLYVVLDATGPARMDIVAVTTAASHLPAPDATPPATPTA